MTQPLAANDLDDVVGRVGGLWEQLRGGRIFITGGTGFFGVWLLETFARANRQWALGARAVVLSRDPAAFAARIGPLAGDETIGFVQGDVKEFPFPPGRFSHVIHAATEASARLVEADPLAMLDTIVLGTRRALEFARQCGAQRFLLTSSGAIYGPQPAEMTHIPEEHAGSPDPLSSRSAYGEGKRLAEHLCAIYHDKAGLGATIARCFAFVGPHLPLDRHFAIGNFIRDGLAGGPIRVGGDGTPYRSYLYASDLAAWLWTILLKGEPMRPYNVGSANDLTIAELAAKVAAHFGTAVEIARGPQRGKPAERYVPSCRRAETELGLRQTVGLDDAIARTVAWWRSAAGG